MASRAAELTISDAVEILTKGFRLNVRRAGTTRHVRGTDRRCFADLHAREVYSYGRHFPLFRYVSKSGRHPAVFVINGDEWRGSNSRTRQHQTDARAVIAELEIILAANGMPVRNVITGSPKAGLLTAWVALNPPEVPPLESAVPE